MARAVTATSTTDYQSYPFSASVRGPWTMFTWARRDSDTDDYQFIFELGSDNVENMGFHISGSGGIFRAQIYDGGGGPNFADNVSTPIGRWVALALRSAASSDADFDVHDPVADHTYNAYSGGGATITSLDKICLCNLYRDGTWAGGWSFDGAVAEPAIWDVVLSDPEIASLQSGMCPLLVRPQSLVFYNDCLRGATQDRISGNVASTSGTLADTDHPAGIITPRNPWVPAWYGAPEGSAGASLHLTPAMRRYYMSILEQ